MKQFEKVTQSVETLAEFLSAENRDDNLGCAGCKAWEACTGKGTCKKAWADFLNSEVDEPAKGESAKGITVKMSVDTSQLDAAIEKANQLNDLLEQAQVKRDGTQLFIRAKVGNGAALGRLIEEIRSIEKEHSCNCTLSEIEIG